MILSRYLGVVFLCLVLFTARFIPHPNNFTPFLALSLFIGYFCQGRWWALTLPLLAMGLSDLKMGFYPGWAFVYIPLVLAVFYGFFLKAQTLSVIFYATVSSFSFFIISNLGVWLYAGLYPLTLEGLWSCYVAAIPFFHKTLLSTLFYSSIIFAVAFLALGLAEEKSKVS